MNELSKDDRRMLLDFGTGLIAETRELILGLWRCGEFSAELKSDRTPVTTVDLRAEELIRRRIAERFPSHGVVGEELGRSNPDAEFQWTVDPIDGTQNLVNRIPTFGTLLGLRFRNRALIGIIDHPVLGLTVSGAIQLGVALNGKPVKLNDLPEPRLEPADVIATSTLDTFNRSGDGHILHGIIEYHPHTRIYYDCYAHSLTIAGSIAATVEYGLKIWDLTPAEALIAEAGGSFCYLEAPEYSNDRGLHHAVFGKKSAVSLLTEAIAQMTRA